MYTCPYTPPEDTATIGSWLRSRNLDASMANSLPEIGVMAFYRGEPIAAGFIRKVEGGFGLLDSLITNPDAPGDLRTTAIDLVVEQLLKIAVARRIERLIAYSVDGNTLTRSQKFGFLRLPHTVIGVNLSK